MRAVSGVAYATLGDQRRNPNRNRKGIEHGVVIEKGIGIGTSKLKGKGIGST